MRMHDSAGETLARFSAHLNLDDIPAKTQTFTKLVLLDALGCLAAGSDTEDASVVAAAAAEALGSGSGPRTASAAQRALVMGYGISASGSIDSYIPAKFHTSPSVIGAALAVATQWTVSGRDLLTAVAVGLESSVRIADAFNPPALRGRGWHAPGVVGPLSSTLSCSRLLGLDAEQTRHALGLAGSQSSGTFAAWGTPTVKFHQARSAMSGLLSAKLAQAGFSSSPDVFGAADGGLLTVYSDGGRPEQITDGLGVNWRMHDLSLRRWPTPHVNTITAIIDLLDQHRDAVDAAERIVVEVSSDAEAFHVFDSPTTRFEAINSIPLTAATALLERTFDQKHLEPEWYLGDVVRTCMKDRIQISVSQELPSGSVRAFPIPLESIGHVVEIHVPFGSRQRPMGRAAVVDKFVQNTRLRLQTEDALRLANDVLAIERANDAGRVITRAGVSV